MSYKVQIVALFALLVPPLVHASGPDESEYYGLLENGTAIHLTLLDETYVQLQKTGQFVALYGAEGNKLYNVCSAREADKRTLFECKPHVSGKPDVIYEAREDTNVKQRAKEVEKRLSLLSDDVVPGTYFVCVKGCGSNAADVLVEMIAVEHD